MSSYEIYNDARTLLLAASVVPASNIHFANEPFSQPSDGSLWLSFDAWAQNIAMIDIGAECYREEGTIRILVMGPAGYGTDDVRQKAKQIANIYRGLGARNPTYLNASITENGQDDTGAWWALSVSVDYWYEDKSSV